MANFTTNLLVKGNQTVSKNVYPCAVNCI